MGVELLRACRVQVELVGSRVLRGVDLTADAGEVVALVGPNGAAKSTLLAALSGDVATSSGEVSMHRQLGHTAIERYSLWRPPVSLWRGRRFPWEAPPEP